MVIILAGYIYISNNPAVIDRISNQSGSQPVTTPTGPPGSVTSPNNTVKLAAFNIQIFGTSKAGKPEVMEVALEPSGTSILLLSRISGTLLRQLYQPSEIP